MSDNVLSNSAYTATIQAPLDLIDIAGWLMNLPDAEYQRCAPPDHIACGSTTTDDGRKMSINVEQIGAGLVIQHYVAEVLQPSHCKMVSISDVYAPQGRSKVRVIWDLSVKPINAESCQYTNSVLSYSTPEYMSFMKTHGITLESAAAARQAASSDHNSRETPLFAASIQRHAFARQRANSSGGVAQAGKVISPREVARPFTPKLADLVESPLFSEVWSDPVLSYRERSIATMAVLIARGRVDELAAHMQTAHAKGVSCQELSALITHTAFYSGFPEAISASGLANQLFGDCKEHGMQGQRA